MSVIRRNRSAAWRLTWRDGDGERVAYLGKWRVGMVVRRRIGRVVKFVPHLSLPGIWGPVTTGEANMLLASTRLSEYVRKWLDGMTEEPPSPSTSTAARRTRTRA